MTPRYPTNFQRKTLWKAITGVSILTIGLFIALLIWLTGQALSYLQPVLVPVAVAGIIAYLLDPIVSLLQRKGLSRLKAVISVFASFLILISLLGYIIIPPIVAQINEVASSKRNDGQNIGERIQKKIESISDAPWLKPAIDYASEKVDPETGIILVKSTKDNAVTVVTPVFQYRWQYILSKYTGNIAKTASHWLRGGTSKILSVLGLLLGFAMAPIYLYYFLKESSSIKAHWHEYVPLKASKFKDEVIDTLQEINGYLISFFRGQMLVAFIDGILVGIALWAFGLPYGLLIGLCMAVIGVIPFIGNIICLIPSCIIAFVHFSYPDNQNFLGENPWAYVGAVAAIFLVVQQINSLFTAPKIVGDSVGLHPMTVIFSMLFWSLLLGGFIGALLAVPLTAAVKVIFRRYIWERKLNESSEELIDTV